MIHKPPFDYEYRFIGHPETGDGSYRIHDADDNVLCHCYSEENAIELVARLNLTAEIIG